MDKHEKLRAELKQYETDVWNALVKGNTTADAKALHDRFIGVYPDGIARKSDHVGQLENGPTIKTFEMSQCVVLPLNDEQAVLIYHVAFMRTAKTVTEKMYVSSIWQRNEKGCINLFSQDTPAIGAV